MLTEDQKEEQKNFINLVRIKAARNLLMDVYFSKAVSRDDMTNLIAHVDTIKFRAEHALVGVSFVDAVSI